MLDVFSEPFASVDTYHLLISHLEKLGLYIEPREIIIGRSNDGKLLKAQYVPVSKILTKFLSLPGVLPTIRQHMMCNDANDTSS
jgi:hypothetical protein